ncbi:MAG: hypothetical protein WA667_19280 [Candidatus Nitrosopolaris sp.]
MKTHYHYDQLADVIAGIAAKPSSILTYFYRDGAPEEIINYKEIGNSTHGSIFLKENWHKDMDMKTVAGIGYFIIHYIEKFQLDLGIGTGNDKHHPQIIFISNSGFDHEPDSQLIQKFEKEARRNLDQLNSKFSLDFC